MQIFSPHTSFIDISNCLDPKRLNKQKVEIYQILNTLYLGAICNKCNHCGKNYKRGLMNCPHCNYNGFHILKTPWYNHPATQAVKGYELFFIDYALEIADSCLQLGYKDTLIPKIQAFKETFKGEYKKPWYWGKEEFHSSHRSNLLRKDPVYYGKFGWKEDSLQEYWWPSKNT